MMVRYVVTLMVLLATAVAHGLIVKAQENAAATNAPPPELLNLPQHILNFRQQGPDMPAPESIRQQLETNSILQRNYVSDSGRVVQLSIVYAEKTRRSLHFPEVCLTGHGWETHGKAPVPIGLSFVGQGLVLQKGDSRQVVIYWFKTGNEFTGSYFMNSFYWARDMLLLRSPSSMMVRISTLTGTQGEEEAFAVLNDFAAGLAPILLETIH